MHNLSNIFEDATVLMNHIIDTCLHNTIKHNIDKIMD